MICSRFAFLSLMVSLAWSSAAAAPVVSVVSPAVVVKSDQGAAKDPKKDTSSVCEVPPVGNARVDSWGNHFAVYEELPSGDRIRLAPDNQFVGAHSVIVVKRITDAPTIRATNGSQDDAEDRDPDGFDVDIVVRRPSNERTCRILVRLPGLQTTGGYDRALRGISGCPENFRYFTEPREIAKDTQWRIPAGTFKHGDSVEIQLHGRFVGDEDFNMKTPHRIKIGDSKANASKREGFELFYTTKRKICGQSWTSNMTIVDFGSIAPLQDSRNGRRQLDDFNGRADTRYPIYFDFTAGAVPPLATGLYAKAISVTATAVDKDGKTRALSLRENTSRPTLESPQDKDTVVVKVSRKYNTEIGASEVTARTYTFSAVAGGLHAALSGERRASYGMTPGFLAVFRSDGKTPVYGFAETFSYTATRRSIYPGFFDEFGFGVHVSVLARKSTESTTDSDSPLSLGLGAHVSFGNNSIQLGTGWDLVNEKVYAVIGISIPEFATFLDNK